jgi:hypothetical protein
MIDKKTRLEIEEMIYTLFDKIDTTGTNTEYYKSLISEMDDKQFEKFLSRRLPFRFHQDAFKIEPKMYEIAEGFKYLGVPMTEKLNLPHVYKDANGVPVQSQNCLVIYTHIKRMKQMISKKNNASMNIDKRDMRTGLLSKEDKGAKETDREFESLASYGLDETLDEFRTVKADAMNASATMLATILDKGSVSQKDYNVTKTDALGRNMLNVYLTGACIHSNLVDEQYMTPLTAKNKRKRIERI